MMSRRMTITSRALVVGLATFAMVVASGANLVAATSRSELQDQRDPARELAHLNKEVRHELVMLPYLSVFDNLEYRVDGTKVTLSGQVVRPSLKEDAGRVVKGIEGVTEVDNQIQVLPPSPMDDQIRHAEFRAIYGFPSLSRYAEGAIPQLHIIVNNGHVTLYGIVDSQADKDTAGLRANSVPNVFSVTNNLQVAGPGK
jgi:hyperosmotically inducible periplasmic protein